MDTPTVLMVMQLQIFIIDPFVHNPMICIKEKKENVITVITLKKRKESRK